MIHHEDTKTQRKEIAVNTKYQPISENIEKLASVVVAAAFQVHCTLGPGLLESVYEICLCHELDKQRVDYFRQMSLPVQYKKLKLDSGLRIDLMVADELIVELKSVEQIHPVHQAQLLTYLKLTKKRLELLINFNVPVIKNGICRVIL